MREALLRPLPATSKCAAKICTNFLFLLLLHKLSIPSRKPRRACCNRPTNQEPGFSDIQTHLAASRPRFSVFSLFALQKRHLRRRFPRRALLSRKKMHLHQVGILVRETLSASWQRNLSVLSPTKVVLGSTLKSRHRIHGKLRKSNTD